MRKFFLLEFTCYFRWFIYACVFWLQHIFYPPHFGKKSFELVLSIAFSGLHLFCLFVLSFSSHSRIFHSFGDVTIAGDGRQIVTYARHLWPFRRKCSLACHTYCDSKHGVISEDPWHSNVMPTVWQYNCLYLFINDFGLS